VNNTEQIRTDTTIHKVFCVLGFARSARSARAALRAGWHGELMALFSPVIRGLIMVLLAGTLLIGYAVSQAVAHRFQRSQVSPAKAKEAKRLFKQKCVKCHGQDGAGNNYGQIIGATNLTDPEWQQRVDDKRIINSIKHGRGQMPALGEKLTEDQILSLMLYVRTLKK